MKSASPSYGGETAYRRILGIDFLVGNAADAVKLATRGGLAVVPSAPALVELDRDPDYRQALLEADLVLTDSGYMVRLWNFLMRDRVHRVSGLEYLTLLLDFPEFRESDSVLWVMPSQVARARNVRWLRAKGYHVEPKNFYIAPRYRPGAVRDEELLDLIHTHRPRHVIIGIGGGVQEKLGLYLKHYCLTGPAIHCIGAAIGFITGDQVWIPTWADKFILGWLFRCISNPRRFIPRYARAVKL